MPDKCTHLKQIKVRTTNKRECEECAQTGDSWVHLRLSAFEAETGRFRPRELQRGQWN